MPIHNKFLAALAKKYQSGGSADLGHTLVPLEQINKVLHNRGVDQQGIKVRCRPH